MARSYQKPFLEKRKLKDGTTSYRIIYRERQPDGTWVQKSQTLERGLSLSEAKERAEAKGKEINNANNGVLVGPVITFKELVERYFYPYIEKEDLRASTKR